MPDGDSGYLFFREEQQYMCGIVGYVGAQQAAPILLDGLRRLEYRGYDSAGMAVCGPEGQEYFVYFQLPQRRIGGKDEPAHGRMALCVRRCT